MVAPIALYPDELLSQVLMAATYPLEVVEAARWSKENPKVTGQALEDAMQKQPWDPSVKALAAVPQTLAMMNDQLKWTQDLGDAFLAQQADVLDAVQRLRARADAAGNLKTTPQQKVTRTNRPAGSPAGAPAQAYMIEPAIRTSTSCRSTIPASSTARGLMRPTCRSTGIRPVTWPPAVRVCRRGLHRRGDLGRRQLVEPARQRQRLRYNQFNRTNITNTNWRHNAAHRGNVPYSNAACRQAVRRRPRKARESAPELRQQRRRQGRGGMGGMGGMGWVAWATAGWAKAEWEGCEGGMGGMGKAEWATAAWVEWPAAWAGWAKADGGMGGGRRHGRGWHGRRWMMGGMPSTWAAWAVAAAGRRLGRRQGRRRRMRGGGGGGWVAAVVAAADGVPTSC